MLKSLLLVAVLALGALLAYAATRPDTFAVERSATISASPERLFPMINDLHRFNTWNPYNRKDPAIKLSYGGPQAGPGARFDFEGNKDVGQGRISITRASPPTQVAMRLDMRAPMEGHNDILFALHPEGQGTRVTWSMHGPSNLLFKVASLFIDMDHMLGQDFEAGLATLKAQAEQATP